MVALCLTQTRLLQHTEYLFADITSRCFQMGGTLALLQDLITADSLHA